MIKPNDFNSLSVQVSIFTPELVFSPGKVLANLVSTFSDTFDGNPMTLPIPADAPKEIPRITLLSSDGRYKLDISFARANFYRYLKETDTDLDEKSFFALCSKVFKEYLDFVSTRVGRIALVTIRFAKNETPGLTLAKHFCQEKWIVEPFDRPENFEIHAHKRYEFDEFSVNSWVRCKTGSLKKEKEPIILIEQDLNTLAEEIENNDFNAKILEKFLNSADKEQNEILLKYFPDED